jgi:L-ascorbate metabolism protein UlaG (beta-lactamase superfamily)
MKITKFEHACFIVEHTGQILVVDPGSFTTPLIDLTNVAAIVLTHEHPDHWTPEQLRRILDRNPNAQIFAPSSIAGKVGADFPITVVQDGDVNQVGPFTIASYGSEHAVIHSSIPVITNVGVLINDSIFYPGDAFTVPPVPVNVLAAPSGAPWMKIAEAMDYVLAVEPKRAFPTHEMVNSVIGKGMANQRLEWATKEAGGEYFPLEPGDTLDV